MPLLAHADLDIHPLILGGNTFGWTSDEPLSFAVLDAFVAAGGHVIDTADAYSTWVPGNKGGESETILGNWLTDRGTRDHVVIASKVGAYGARPGLARSNVDAALEESLERLQTNYVDIYYAHRDDDSVAIIDQVRTFHDLVASGRVRHLGLSNFSPQRMREWFDTTQREGLTIPVAIQPLYNLVERRSFEQGYAQVARDFGAAVFPYYPLASGFLAGKYRVQSDIDRYPRGATIQKYLTAAGLGLLKALDEAAAARGREPASIALAWLLAKGVTAPIASVSRPEQLAELFEATRLELAPAEVAALDTASSSFA